MAQAFDRAIVQIEMRHPRVRGQRIGIHGKPVVLGRDLDLVAIEILDRMVGAAMPELELVGLGTQGEAEQLMAETDAEDGPVRRVDQRAHVVDCIGDRGRIAGAVAQEDAVWIVRRAGPPRGPTAGKTRTSQPCAASRRRILVLIP